MFYDRFSELCKRARVTPAKVAESIGIKKSTMYMWKKQGTTPKYDTVKKLADYFGVTTDDLYDIKPLPDGKVELDLSNGKKTVVAPGWTLEVRAVNTFLKDLGFLIGMDKSLIVELIDNDLDTKDAETWFIADKREKKVYLAKATDLDTLADRILSFSKFEIYELIRKLPETTRYKDTSPPKPPPAPQEGTDTTPAPEGDEGPQEGE